MTRQEAATQLRLLLDEHKLQDWSIRLSAAVHHGAYGLCSYKDKCIILNALHIDTHPDAEVLDTIRHEVAHALVGGSQGHNSVWQDKARELGATPTPCSTMALSDEAIDAIRSGATLEVTFDEIVVRTPKYKVTRLQDKCPTCNKVAVTIKEYVIEDKDDTKPDLKIIKLQCGHSITKNIPKGTPFHTLVSDFKMLKCPKHEWNGKTTCIKCGEFKPYQFQVEGMNFIEAALAGNKGALVADEMGLGKTIQALGYLKFHPEQSPTLYVVKSSITYQWVKQILVWMGDEFVPQVIKTSKEYLIPNLKSYVISYDMMVFKTKTLKSGKTVTMGFDISQFDRVGIKTVVLDECQQIKNPDSSRTQTIRKLVKGRNVIALSGTPWKNRGSEFFSVLNMIAPMKFHSYANYLNTWVEKYWDGNKLKEGGINRPEKFKEYIKEICIRRERKEVMKDLPLVNRMRLYIQLDEFHQGEYDGEVSDFVKWFNDAVIGGEEDNLGSMQMLARLSRMRHITGLAKIPATVEFTREFVEETDRKLVIFVHHKDVGELIYRQMVDEFGKEIRILRLTGDQSSQERFQIQEDFNKPERCIMVASTLASGEGLNLQSGADCIIHERQWNPANEEQVEGRFIRIGQTATSVNATYTTAEGTIDDLFDGIVESKRNQFHAAMNSGEGTKWIEGDLIRQLAQALVDRFKKKNPSKSTNGEKPKSITEMVRM